MRRAISRHAHTLRLASLLVVTLLLVPAFLPGCDDDKVANPPPAGYAAATSPSLCLANLRDAYEEQKGDEYARLFDDDFVFVFNPDDVSDPENPTPATWGLASELQSARNLFADSTVERIDLSWNVGDSTAWSEVSPDGLKVRLDGVYLTVSTRNEQGEPLYLVVQGAVQWFYFVPDPSTGGGTRVWKVREWEDSPIGGKVEENSWGSIKALFL